MRHRKSGRKLNRTSSHRQAMLRNMACSLFRHEEIRTTLPKAKELRRVAEPLITLGKRASVANRRLAFARLRDREIVGKLFNDLGIRFKDRPGGYLRILKAGYRAGDAAPLAIVQLVERTAAVPPVVTAPAEPREGAGATAKPPAKAKAAPKQKPPTKKTATKKKAPVAAKKATPKTKKKTAKTKKVVKKKDKTK